MRTNIPSFRLPQTVLDEEIGMILDMGVDLRLNTPVDEHAGAARQGRLRRRVRRLRRAQGQGAEAARAASGTDHIHIGIDWLESVAFGHIDKIGERVLIIGVGNTAMDCCRTSLRLGATEREGHGAQAARLLQGFRRGSSRTPRRRTSRSSSTTRRRRFVIENGKLTGMLFDQMEYELDGRAHHVPSASSARSSLPCDDVILAIGQENAFPWIERDLGIEFDKWDVPRGRQGTFQSTRPGVFFGGDAAFGPKNIIWAVEHGHQAAISITTTARARHVSERPAAGREAAQPQDGHARVVVHERLRRRSSGG